MLKITFIVPAEEVNLLQRYAYEMEAQKRIVKEIITDDTLGPSVLEGATFKKYHEAYQQSAASFEIARDAIQAKFVPEELRNLGNATQWNLDYSSQVLTITVNSNAFDTSYKNIAFAAENVNVEVVSGVANACSCGGNC